jgi:hypothetical protein
MFLRIYLQKKVSSGFSCTFTCENRFPADFSVDITTELPADCLQERCCRFFSHFRQKIFRKQLPTKVLAGNQNPFPFPADFWSKTAGKSAGNK